MYLTIPSEFMYSKVWFLALHIYTNLDNCAPPLLLTGSRPLNYSSINCSSINAAKCMPCVVCFDQRLGAAHSKRWSKYAFLMFSRQKVKKMKKARNLQQNLTKTGFLSLLQNAGWVFYSQIKQVFSYKNTFLPTIVTQPNLWCKLKKPFFVKFCGKFLDFFSFFLAFCH